MSSLLEQAIVDAKALKDAAIKNAENLVIEKYSEQIKQAVDVFLEQEDEEDPLDLAGEEVGVVDVGEGAAGGVGIVVAVIHHRAENFEGGRNASLHR